MYFKQFYLACLAHASYLIGSENEAAVVDPQRDVDQYIKEAEANSLKIKYVIETHLHADFVSGHRELAARTGAEIVFGANARATFPHRAVRDGDEIKAGRVVLRIMETPGHTPESISVLIIDTEVSDQPQKVLTGDTLFMQSIGRTDLWGGSYSEIINSIQKKLMNFDDDTFVIAGHGQSTTIGHERRHNPFLR